MGTKRRYSPFWRIFTYLIFAHRIYLLIALKRSLSDLDVAYNDRITDDAIPALLIMDKLQYLSLLETSITIAGVRRLAVELDESKRFIEVEVPRSCEQYINSASPEFIVSQNSVRELNLHFPVELSQKYVVDPMSPLITDPLAVDLLSLSALKHNLAAHAEVNSEISAKGAKTELAERLKTILDTRKADLLAQKLVWQIDE